MQLHILPIKSFLRLDMADRPAAAVISTALDIDEKKIACPYVLAEYMDFDYASRRSFSPEQAAAFAAFVRGLSPDTKELYVCCDAGESRSAAIAAAIHRWLGQSDSYIWESPKYHPNVLCFCRMLEALQIPITDGELDILIYTNRNAFRKGLQ